MNAKQIFNEAYLTSRAEQAIKDSLKQLSGKERKEFAEQALSYCEANNAPLELLDELYLAYSS